MAEFTAVNIGLELISSGLEVVAGLAQLVPPSSS